MGKRQWEYICCDCGRRMQIGDGLCPRCVRNGMPGDRVDKICCNTCIHVHELDAEGTHAQCRKDKKWREIGDRCNLYIMMEENVPLHELE